MPLNIAIRRRQFGSDLQRRRSNDCDLSRRSGLGSPKRTTNRSKSVSLLKPLQKEVNWVESIAIACCSIRQAAWRILFHTQTIGTGHHGENYSSLDGCRKSKIRVLEWGLTISAGAPDPWHLLRRTPWREEGMSRRCRMGHPGCRSNSTSFQSGHSIQEPTLRFLLSLVL